MVKQEPFLISVGRKVDAITVHTGMSVDSMLKFRDMNTVISEQWEKKRPWRQCG